MTNGLMRLTVAMLLLSAIVCFAENGELSGKIAFVSLTTVKVAKEGTLHAEFAPKVVLRLTRKGSSSGFLAMTGLDGTAFVPVEAGTYCVEAFGVDGRIAKLSAYSRESKYRCFTAVAGKAVDFTVTLAADAKYGGTVPSLGVK